MSVGRAVTQFEYRWHQRLVKETPMCHIGLPRSVAVHAELSLVHESKKKNRGPPLVVFTGYLGSTLMPYPSEIIRRHRGIHGWVHHAVV